MNSYSIKIHSGNRFKPVIVFICRFFTVFLIVPENLKVKHSRKFPKPLVTEKASEKFQKLLMLFFLKEQQQQTKVATPIEIPQKSLRQVSFNRDTHKTK